MGEFWTVNFQADLFGLVSAGFAAAALFIGVISLLTKEHKNHIYTGVILTSFLLCAGFLGNALFILVQIEDPVFPYLQFGRTVFFILGGLAAVWTFYWIFRSVE